MEDKFKFKKFLATVSVFVMITSSSSYAMSTTYTSRTKNISILAGEELTLGGKIQGATLDLQGADSTLNLENGFTLDIAVTSDVAGEGIVNVLGAGNVVAGKNIGTSGTRVKDVNFFTGNNITGQTLNFGSKVYASGEITMEKYNTFKAINENVVLDAPEVKAKDASFDLGSNGKVTVDGGNLTFSGKEGRIAVTIAQSGELVSGGQIVVGNGAILKYENGSEITITPDDSNGSRPSAGKSRAFTLIQNNTGKAADGTPVVNLYSSTYPFTKWAGSFDSDGHLILTQTDKFAEEIKKILGGNLNVIDQSNTDLLASAEADTDAAKFVNEVLAKLTNNKKKLDEAIDRLTSVTTATDSIENAMKVLINVINTRLSLAGKQAVGIPVQSRAAASAKVTGVAASEEHTRYGLWFSPFFSKTTQKARKCATGYKDTTYGGSFGMDTRANDDLILGTAVTFANLEMKYKDSKSGDKIKVGSLMLSIYALQNITDTWFAQGSTTIASNKIKNSRKRVRNMTAFDVAEGKYNSMSFIGDVLFGYNYATEGVNLTPMTGARYTRVNSAGYKENGSTTGQNLNVLQKASNKFEVVVGGRLSGGTLDLNGVSVTPELHGFISHDIIGKNSKQDLRICGTPASLSAKSSKSIRTSYNLGLGVNADYGMMEYSIGYDVRLAEKRVGHKGTLKVRVNF